MSDQTPSVLRFLVVPSECGHGQSPPTDFEINGCPEIIVRVCDTCRRELWWNVDRWRALIPDLGASKEPPTTSKDLEVSEPTGGDSPVKLTHGRHCRCTACAREDWTNPRLAPCGMHGAACPAAYQPYDVPLGTWVHADGRPSVGWAVRVIAGRALSHFVTVSEPELWEDFPEIGENDWRWVEREIVALAQSHDHDQRAFETAYKRLVERAIDPPLSPENVA